MNNSYSGVEVDLTDAQLVGVTGFQLWSQGTAKVNSAPTAQRIDWTTATQGLSNDPDSLLADLDILKSVELQVEGAASLAVGSGGNYNVVASITASTLTFATMDVVTGNTTLGTIADANVVSFEITAATLFVGTGHGGLDATHQPVGLTGDEVGFSASGGFKFVSVSDGTNSYSGVEVDLTDAELVGVDGFELWSQGTAKVNVAQGAERIDWTTATQGSTWAAPPSCGG